MTTEELIEALEARFGNPYAPKHYHIIQEAVEQLRFLNDEIKACYQHIKDLQEK